MKTHVAKFILNNFAHCSSLKQCPRPPLGGVEEVPRYLGDGEDFVVAATRGSNSKGCKKRNHLSVLSLPNVSLAESKPVPHLSDLVWEMTCVFGDPTETSQKRTSRFDRSISRTARTRPTNVIPKPDIPTPPNTERRLISRGMHDRPVTRTKRSPETNRRRRGSRQDPIANVV